MQRKIKLHQPIGEHVDIDNLIDIGNALGLGHRRRIDCVPRGLRPFAIDIDTQIGCERRIVGGVIGAVHGGCAVDHRAGRAGDLARGALKGKAQKRARIGVAVAIG